MTAKIIKIPKSNQQLFDDLFMGFQSQIDKLVAAKDMNRVIEVPEKEEKC